MQSTIRFMSLGDDEQVSMLEYVIGRDCPVSFGAPDSITSKCVHRLLKRGSIKVSNRFCDVNHIVIPCDAYDHANDLLMKMVCGDGCTHYLELVDARDRHTPTLVRKFNGKMYAYSYKNRMWGVAVRGGAPHEDPHVVGIRTAFQMVMQQKETDPNTAARAAAAIDQLDRDPSVEGRKAAIQAFNAGRR